MTVTIEEMYFHIHHIRYQTGRKKSWKEGYLIFSSLLFSLLISKFSFRLLLSFPNIGKLGILFYVLYALEDKGIMFLRSVGSRLCSDMASFVFSWPYCSKM